MKRILSILFLVLFFINSYSQTPKIINYFLSWDKFSPSIDQAVELAKWDVIVLDMENQLLHPEIFPVIRNINPDIIILAFISSQEIYDNINEDGALRKQLKSGIQNSWWLKETNGDGIVFWTGTHMLNCSNQCPKVDGQNWSKYLGTFISNYILSNNLWDGVFLDNCWDILMDTIKGKYINYDIDNNGEWDDPNWRNHEWLIGMDTLISTIRTVYPDKIIIGNGGHTYIQYLNGSLIENFHEWETSWENAMSKYLNMDRNGITPTLTAINSYNNNQYDYKKMRYGLTNCLLGNGYYSFDYGDTAHSQLWWYDEYDAQIGIPTEMATSIPSQQSIQLLQNTGFESPLTNIWQIDPDTNYGNFSSDNSTSHSGNYSMKCSLTSLPSSRIYHAFTVKQTGFSVERDSLYKISFWAKSTSPRIISTMILGDKDPWDHLFYNLPKIQIGKQWQYFEYYVYMNDFRTVEPDKTLPSDTRFSFELGWDLSTVWIDDVSLTKCSPSLWKREYTNGLVVCNPTYFTKTMELSQPYYTINGDVIPTIDGKRTVTISSKDGLILLKNKPASNLVPLIHNKGFNIFPNPNKGLITISSLGGINISDIIKIQLLNLEGRVEAVLTQSKDIPSQINLSNKIKSGTYLLKIICKEGDFVEKIVVDK